MTYHVMLRAERRQAPRELAMSVDGQLHITCETIADLNDPQFLYIAEWDGHSPYLNVVRPNPVQRTVLYYGWPESGEPPA